MKQESAPLYKALVEWQKKKPISFHVPGHKNGTVFPKWALESFEPLLSIDATELNGLDDLHWPQTVIRDAERLTAQLYGSEDCYFLVGGSTVGNLAMIMATCDEGDVVFVQRNSHKSIMNSLKLTNVHPVFLTPFVDETTKTAVGVSAETVKEAHSAYPSAKAIILTNPTYYGMSVDLQEIIAFAREKKMTVLVDEAHGAHFILGSVFPLSAVTLGADIVVQSAHKTLPAMTMASWLHVNAGFSKRENLRTCLSMLQSSSPSYPLMASLDLARWYLANLSMDDVDDIVRSIESFQRRLDSIPGIRVVKPQDPLKTIIQSANGLSGFELQKRLEEKGIFTELADERNVLFVHPLAVARDQETVLSLISQALSNSSGPVFPQERAEENLFHPYTSLALSYKAMSGRQVKEVTLNEAEGEIAAESIIPYPPGIPLFIEGETISKSRLTAIRRLLAAGARFQGGKRLKDGYLLVYSKKGV